jgi:hypothetical protein
LRQRQATTFQRFFSKSVETAQKTGCGRTSFSQRQLNAPFLMEHLSSAGSQVSHLLVQALKPYHRMPVLTLSHSSQSRGQEQSSTVAFCVQQHICTAAPWAKGGMRGEHSCNRGRLARDRSDATLLERPSQLQSKLVAAELLALAWASGAPGAWTQSKVPVSASRPSLVATYDA